MSGVAQTATVDGDVVGSITTYVEDGETDVTYWEKTAGSPTVAARSSRSSSIGAVDDRPERS